MTEYYSILKDWKAVTNEDDFRNISHETLTNANVTIHDTEALFPYGGNKQVPDRFKVINIESKAQYFSAKSPLVCDDEDYTLPFFNQQDFPDKTYIIITEGEWDCLSWIEVGYVNAVSLPNGITAAPKVFEREFQYINSFDQVYVNFDADKLGKQMIEKIKQMIPKHKFRSIFFDIEGVKDANGALRAGYGLSDFYKTAFREKMETVIHASEISIDEIFSATPEGKTTGFVDLDEILGGLRSHELTVVTGDTGSGKTTFAANLALNVAERTNTGVWITSQEMRPAKVLEKMGSIILKQSIRKDKIDDYSKERLPW